ncbi:MAG: hypothetical protein BJ554DRAFT_8355 [Olpidium bornovanus]|uniref:Decapping nuclease n=1 Tax=Olpidium bornovanus TaxID=278681 RepID=A0A8H7ZVA5_9FUNG|nr:MAG: hypothetical protein BJ554DRAFT_8355 [Olpidium bornovanus]
MDARGDDPPPTPGAARCEPRLPEGVESGDCGRRAVVLGAERSRAGEGQTREDDAGAVTACTPDLPAGGEREQREEQGVAEGGGPPQDAPAERVPLDRATIPTPLLDSLPSNSSSPPPPTCREPFLQDYRSDPGCHRRRHSRPSRDGGASRAATALFPIVPIDRFRRPCARYQRPREVTTFSYDSSRRFVAGDSEMKYFHPPNLPREVCDLSAGYDTYVTRAEVDEHIDGLLDALIELEHRKGPGEAKADFVCYRGIMTKIMTAPYTKDPLELRATRFRGTIFLEEHELEETRKRKHGETAKHRLMCYWGALVFGVMVEKADIGPRTLTVPAGYKFESYCTSPKAPHEVTPQDIQRSRDAPVNTNVQHCVVFRSKLGRNSIIMGAGERARWRKKSARRQNNVFLRFRRALSDIYRPFFPRLLVHRLILNQSEVFVRPKARRARYT